VVEETLVVKSATVAILVSAAPELAVAAQSAELVEVAGAGAELQLRELAGRQREMICYFSASAPLSLLVHGLVLAQAQVLTPCCSFGLVQWPTTQLQERQEESLVAVVALSLCPSCSCSILLVAGQQHHQVTERH